MVGKRIALCMTVITLAMLVLAGCGKKNSDLDTKESGHIELTDEMDWYSYDPDNLFGISATVVDDHTVTYVFDREKCLFTAEDVTNAYKEGNIEGCKGGGAPRYTPEEVSYSEDDENVYLSMTYPGKQDMSNVNGFWFYISEDEYLRCGYTKSTMYIDHVIITERHNAGEDGYQWDVRWGNDWTQSWNLNDSGSWSEPYDRHYNWNNMPLE